jgi:hypothetical protein
MPFSATEHGPDDHRRKITEAQWSHIYEHWIKRAIESFQPEKIVCKRSPAKPGNFVKGIVADLDSSGLVIADLTGAKPNVYYELGIRHALRVGTIIITQHFDALPSDLRGYFVFEYSYSEKDYEYEEYYAKFEKKMHETLQAWSDTDDPSDSPVSDFLGMIHQRVEKELVQEKEELKNIFAKLKEHFTHNFEVSEAILAIMKHEAPKDCERLFVVDVFAIDTVYLHLVGYNWKHIKGDGLEMLEKIIVYQRRLFNEVSVTWNALHGNPEQPRLARYLINMLEELNKEKQRFDEQWDVLTKGAIETIKLVKHGKQT